MRTFVSPVIHISIEYKIYDLNCSVQIYKEFYKWMYENCRKDKKYVVQQKLEYLEESYEDLLSKIEHRKMDENVNVKLMSFSKNNEKIFGEYLNANKEEYFSFDKKQNKKSRYYNNLCSWYDLSIEGTDEAIDNLYKTSKEDGTKQKYNDYFKMHSKLECDDKIFLAGEY